jgi:hypothetical protein
VNEPSKNFVLGGRRGRDYMVVCLQLLMQLMPITTNVASSNTTQLRFTRYHIM